MCTYKTERFTKAGLAMHTCNGDVITGLPFGKKAEPGTCRRCDELRAGAKARVPNFVQSKLDEQATCEAIRRHFAPGGRGYELNQQGLGHTDTAFQW